MFIPVADQRGLISAIDAWVLTTAAAQLQPWDASGHCGLTTAVNVSPLHFEQDTFVSELQGALAGSGLACGTLPLERTEGTLLKDVGAFSVKRQQVRAPGVDIALDDVGTECSSVANLRALPVNEVKIDRSFLQALRQDGPAFVDTITHIARRLGLRTVAEGIETPAQRPALLKRR